MPLTDYRLLRDQHSFRKSGHTAVRCDDDNQPVVAVVPRAVLDDYYGWKASTEIRRDSCVDQNLKIFAEIIAEKYARGEHQPWRDVAGELVPLVSIELSDIRACGKLLTIPPDIEKMAGFGAPSGGRVQSTS